MVFRSVKYQTLLQINFYRILYLLIIVMYFIKCEIDYCLSIYKNKNYTENHIREV